MKILFIGATNQESTSVFYYDALKELGFEVKAWEPVIYERFLIFNRPSSKRIQKAEEDLIKLCKETAWDQIWFFNQNFFGARSLEEIRKHSRPTCIYHSHDNLFSEGVQKGADFFNFLKQVDFAFTTKSQNVVKYKSLGQHQSFYLPSAFEPRVHHPWDQLSKIFPISFVGTFDHSRIPCLSALHPELLHIWGNGWNRAKNLKNAHITSQAIYHFEYSKVLSRSYCSLGLLREEAGDLHTQRTFEIPACKTLQIAPRNDELASFFKEDEEILFFSTPEELNEKTEWCIENFEVAQKMAEKAYERIYKDGHTYLNRVKTIILQSSKPKAPLRGEA